MTASLHTSFAYNQVGLLFDNITVFCCPCAGAKPRHVCCCCLLADCGALTLPAWHCSSRLTTLAGWTYNKEAEVSLEGSVLAALHRVTALAGNCCACQAGLQLHVWVGAAVLPALEVYCAHPGLQPRFLVCMTRAHGAALGILLKQAGTVPLVLCTEKVPGPKPLDSAKQPN